MQHKFFWTGCPGSRLLDHQRPRWEHSTLTPWRQSYRTVLLQLTVHQHLNFTQASKRELLELAAVRISNSVLPTQFLASVLDPTLPKSSLRISLLGTETSIYSTKERLVLKAGKLGTDLEASASSDPAGTASNSCEGV